MLFNSFRFQVWLRIIIITAVVVGTVWLWLNTSLIVTKVMASVVAFLLMVDLITYVERTNNRLTSLFEAIRYSDFTRSFTMRQMGNSFDQLDKALNEVMLSFQKAREEREEALRYLETVVQHVSVGLLVFNQKGEVETLNAEGKRLLNLFVIRYVSDLKAISPLLVKTLEEAHSGDSGTIRLNIANEEKTLAFAITEFRKKDLLYKLVSLKNIQSELQGKEFESYQNITKVMTHEIANSITPIASLSGTIGGLIRSEMTDEGQLSEDTLSDIQEAMSVIERRSEGIKGLIQAYREFGTLPKPLFKALAIKEMFVSIVGLYRTETSEQSIRLSYSCEPVDIEIHADRDMVEMSLINLVRNAIHAVEGRANGSINLSATLDSHSRVLIEVSDNGQGIIPEAIDKIFVPFFTTKQGGSGIGLALTRQIMHLHGGTIRVNSTPEQGTTFTMRF